MARPQWSLPAGIPGAPPTDPERALVPARGFLLDTQTQGDADGLCFEVTVLPGARLTLDIEGAVAQWTLGDLSQGARALPAANGGVVTVSSHDLSSRAPVTQRHFGQAATRAALHTHSSFSTNLFELGRVVEGMQAFVRTVWWTDHNLGTPRRILGGDFESEDRTRALWQTQSTGVTVLRAGRVGSQHATARAGVGCWGLEVEAGPEGGSAWSSIEKGERAGQLYVALPARPTLLFSWEPRAESIAFVDVRLASQKRIRYLSRRPPRGFDPAQEIVLSSAGDEWSDQRIDLAADVARLFGADHTDGLLSVAVGVLCQPNSKALALFDEVRLEVPSPEQSIRAQQSSFAALPDLQSHVGMEQSAWRDQDHFGQLVPHLTFLAPVDVSAELPESDHALTASERRAMVEDIQRLGGAVGAHHMQYADHYNALLDGDGLGADLFEVGTRWKSAPFYATEAERQAREALSYPQPDGDEDELFPLLVRWDRTTARGLLLTANGAPDLNGRWAQPSERSFNRWLTHILTTDSAGDEGNELNDPAHELLRSLRSGRASASEWRSGAVLSLETVSGQGMGKLLVTDQSSVQLMARISSAVPGSTLRLIAGRFVRQVGGLTPWEPSRVVAEMPIGPSGELEHEFSFGTQLAGFARLELRNPSGHLEALSNPVHVVPYWPQHWPFGRVAFDWGGVALSSEQGLLLESARIDPDGKLLLEGRAYRSGARLDLSCKSAPTVKASVGSPGWSATNSLFQLEELPEGSFNIQLTFDEPLSPGVTRPLRAIPARMRVAATLPLPSPRPALTTRTEATFSVPANSTTTLRMRTVSEASGRHPSSSAPTSGRLLIEGQEVASFQQGAPMEFPLPAQAIAQEFTFVVLLDPLSEDGDPVLLSDLQLFQAQPADDTAVLEY